MFVYQFLLTVSILLMLVLILLVLRKSRKKQIHYAVLAIAVSLLTWNTSVLCHISFPEISWVQAASERFYFTGIILVSLAVLLAGLIFAQTKISFSAKYGLLLVVPVLLLFALFTNPWHHLFYTTFSLIPSEQDFGILYWVHTIYSYLSIGVGLYCFLSFAVKNYGFFSRQALIIFFALLIAVIADSFSTFHIFNWSAAVENVIFSVTVLIFILAIVKYNFLNVVPIALHKVVDIISDVYVVFNEENEIVDYNHAFAATWAGVYRKAGIRQVLGQNCPGFDAGAFDSMLRRAIDEQRMVSFETVCPVDGGEIYYQAEITPVMVKNSHVGAILLMKDITEQKKNLEEVIRLNERLQSLATRDWLTQAYNRYYFDELLEQEIERVALMQLCGKDAADRACGFGLIMFDIDYFKIYNDLNGHQAGDELLQTMVALVQDIIFTNDILCRYGGEEFAVICCDTAAEGVAIAAEKIRRAVEDYDFKYQGMQPGGNLTVSVGAAYCEPPFCKADELIHAADQNLYSAKNTGRNKVVLW